MLLLKDVLMVDTSTWIAVSGREARGGGDSDDPIDDDDDGDRGEMGYGMDGLNGQIWKWGRKKEGV